MHEKKSEIVGKKVRIKGENNTYLNVVYNIYNGNWTGGYGVCM